VAEESWPLIAGWLVAALLPNIPHAVLLLSGLQGSGKSCAARMLVLLVDPSAAPLRSEPRDLEQWQVAASGSWAVAIDNLSHIPTWLSDAICKAATGDGLVKRKLYTDGELAVLAFRRVVLLTSIDTGALRGDLGDRLLLVDLEPIPETARRTEQEVDALFAQGRPQLFGALLDALAAVLAKLPNVRPSQLPRMADFGRVLAAADAAGVTQAALDRFRGQQGRIAGEVVDCDPFAVALVEFFQGQSEWSGTASELLAALLPDASDKLPHGWPRRNVVKGRLKRLTPALAAQGIIVRWEREGATRERRRLIHITGKGGENIVRTVRTVREPLSVGPVSDDPDTTDASFPTASKAKKQPKTPASDDSDDPDDDFPVLSNDDEPPAHKGQDGLFNDPSSDGPYPSADDAADPEAMPDGSWRFAHDPVIDALSNGELVAVDLVKPADAQDRTRRKRKPSRTGDGPSLPLEGRRGEP
jgi:hypothetical protein